jgi:hypothetical protein
MRPLKAMELLAVWEHSLNRTVLERVLALLIAACPEIDSEAIAELSIGERDARLLQLREWMFGSHLVNTARCPRCTERVEWENRIADIRIQPSQRTSSPAEFTLNVADYSLRFRLPTSMDIAAVMNASRGDSTPQDLLKRCIVSARHAGEACDPGSLPEDVLAALGRRIEELDPQAEIRIDLTCPQCSHKWDVLFDIASFLWTEINHWAERTLRTVHKLASAYGWSERDILNLSPVRRRLYLGFVNQ